MNCPICDKVGLPDYRIIPTECPQCNSDLVSFLLINNIQEDKIQVAKELDIAAEEKLRIAKEVENRRNINNAKWIFSIVALSLFFGIIFWQYPNTVTKTIEVTTETKNDSTDYFKFEIANLINKINQVNDTNKILKHLIIQGDNLGSISKKYYNDFNHIDKIAKENRISNQNLIVVGEILFIDLSETK